MSADYHRRLALAYAAHAYDVAPFTPAAWRLAEDLAAEQLARRVDAHQRARILRDAARRTVPARDASAWIAARLAADRQEAIGNGASA